MTVLRDVLRVAGQLAAAMSEAEYALDFIQALHQDGVPWLERSRNNHVTTSEDGLSDVLVACMRNAYPNVAREENSGGHADVILKHPVTFSFALSSEAKVVGVKGFPWYRDGLTKLVAKYNSGRNPHALLLCYCRRKNMHAEMTRFSARIARDRTADFKRARVLADFGFASDVRGIFVTEHVSNGAELNVFHLWINMYYVTDKELLAGRAPAARS